MMVLYGAFGGGVGQPPESLSMQQYVKSQKVCYAFNDKLTEEAPKTNQVIVLLRWHHLGTHIIWLRQIGTPAILQTSLCDLNFPAVVECSICTRLFIHAQRDYCEFPQRRDTVTNHCFSLTSHRPKSSPHGLFPTSGQWVNRSKSITGLSLQPLPRLISP